MSKIQFTNRAFTTLNGSITASTTSVTVSSVVDFPSSGDFYIAVNNETMKVTSITSNTFTVERGTDGNLPVAHADASYVFAIITRDQLDDYGSDIVPFGNFGYGNKISDNNGVTLDSTDFSNYNFTGASKSDDTWGGIVVNADASGLNNWQIISRAEPATPYTLVAHVMLGPGGNTGDSSVDDNTLSQRIGVGFQDTATSDLLIATVALRQIIKCTYHTSYTSSGSTQGSELDYVGKDIWFKCTNDGTTMTLFASVNGSNWTEIHSEDEGTNITPDRLCFAVNSPEATNAEIPAHLLAWYEIED